MDAVQGLGILPDTLICTDSSDSSWKAASLYPELQPFISVDDTDVNSHVGGDDDSPSFGRNSGLEDDGVNTDEEETQYHPRFTHYDDLLLKYKQKRKAALIGVLTLGLAGLSVIGIGETWRNNIFRGTSMDQGGVGFVLKIISFCLLSVLIAIPVFIISLIQLIYYSIKISSFRQ